MDEGQERETIELCGGIAAVAMITG